MFKKIFFCGFFLISGCGFSPLYSLNNDEKTIGLTEEILISPISEYNGYILHSELENALNPSKRNVSKKYILTIHLQKPVFTDQSIQRDNFSNRKKISLTATYTLKELVSNKTLISSSTTALGSYNISNEPYATNKAQGSQIEDLIKIISNNISLYVITYFKKEDVNSENRTIKD